MKELTMSSYDVMDASPVQGPSPHLVWVHRVALLVAFFALLLISFGGHVTTIDAGDTEPAWSFRFWDWFVAWSQLDGGHFYEMTHRQLGTIVGFLTILMVGLMWRFERRAWVRRLGYVALALIVVQGVLGGIRVLVVSDPAVQETAMQATGVAHAFGVRVLFGMVHATLGLALFALLIGITDMTSPRWFAPRVAADPRAVRLLRGVAVCTIAALVLQVILGAWLRHAGWQVGVIIVHALGALTAALFVLILAVIAFGLDKEATLVRKPAFVLAALVQVQIFLGLFAFALPVWAPIRTFHHITGALLLAVAVMIAFRAWHTLELRSAHG